MRKLTVKRRKAIAGCAGKVKLYIQDFNGNTEINGTYCRLLGKLKNKESATYEIGNDSYKLFAIYDNTTKNFCNDYYIIPEGEDDIEVTGAAHFGCGNPFLFDGVTDEGVLANRAKNRKRGIILLVSIFVSALIFGICGIVIL